LVRVSELDKSVSLARRAVYWSDIVTHTLGKTLLAVAVSVVAAGFMLEFLGDARLSIFAIAALGPLLFIPGLAWAGYRAHRETVELKSRLRALVSVETLPSVMNPAAFLLFAEKLRTMSIRQSRQLSLLTIRIKHFETIRGTLGKRRGDALIRQFAAQIVAAVRIDADLVSRIQEVEFAVLLIDADLEAARRVAQRLSNSIARADFGGTVVSAEIGAATVTATDITIEDLIDRAKSRIGAFAGPDDKAPSHPVRPESLPVPATA